MDKVRRTGQEAAFSHKKVFPRESEGSSLPLGIQGLNGSN